MSVYIGYPKDIHGYIYRALKSRALKRRAQSFKRRAIKRRAQSIKRRAIKRRAQVIKRCAGHDGEARHHIGLRARFVVWRQVARDARVCLGYLTKTDAEAEAEAKTKNWLKTSEKLFVVLREILCNTL